MPSHNKRAREDPKWTSLQERSTAMLVEWNERYGHTHAALSNAVKYLRNATTIAVPDARAAHEAARRRREESVRDVVQRVGREWAQGRGDIRDAIKRLHDYVDLADSGHGDDPEEGAHVLIEGMKEDCGIWRRKWSRRLTSWLQLLDATCHLDSPAPPSAPPVPADMQHDARRMAQEMKSLQKAFQTQVDRAATITGKERPANDPMHWGDRDDDSDEEGLFEEEPSRAAAGGGGRGGVSQAMRRLAESRRVPWAESGKRGRHE